MEIVRFGLVGLVATATHMTVAAVLLWSFPDMPVLLANLIAFAIAFIVSFVGHSRFTFRRSGSPVKFFATSVVGFVVNNLVLVAVLLLTNWRLGAVAVAALVSPVVVYLLSRHWVFLNTKATS
jgi:putative flippase GtrA